MLDLPSVLPASFRGVPFAVRIDTIQAGRRFAAHVYPGKDGQSLEDLGRRGRRYSVRGFIVSDGLYGGGPVALQRQLLLAVAEQPGTGILVHPTLGILTVGCESLSIGDDLDAGTKAEVEFSFLEDTQQSILGISVSTIAAVLGAATLVDAAASAAFTAASLSGASGSVAAARWSGQVVTGAQDATALTNLASQLPGPYGRYFSGANAGPLSTGSGSPYSADTTVAQIAADAVTARAAVGAAAVVVSSSFAALNGIAAPQTAGEVQALVAALLALLRRSRGRRPHPFRPSRQLGDGHSQRWTTSTGARRSLRRRGRSSNYQPSSANDATSLQGQIAALLDNEITIAGDEGDDGSYQALKALRAAVVADLQARGAALAPLATFTLPCSLPALCVAQNLYGDSMRADELVAEADPVNPLFMPATFQALAA